MKRTKTNIVIIALMFLTFLGQAFASATISCSHSMMMDMESSTMAPDDMSGMESHANVVLINGEQADNQDVLMDCCQEQCKCPMNGCVNLSLLFHTQLNAEIISEQKITQLPLIHQSQINTSLYRPPIS